MKETKDLKRSTDFLCLISEATKPLSSESVRRIFSPETLGTASQCRSSLDFLRMIESLDLPELRGKDFTLQRGERSQSTKLLDSFLATGELPTDEQVSEIISDLRESARQSFTDHVTGAAVAGAVVGAIAGAFGAGLVTSPVGGVGASVGALAGAIAGGVAGAVGGVINWAFDD